MRARWATRVTLALLVATTQAAAQTPEPPQTESAQGGQNTVPPVEHTGWKTLIKDTGRDFAAFPRRKSTWVLLAAGGVAALAVHPADDYVQSHILGNDTADKFFKPGKIIGARRFRSVRPWGCGRPDATSCQRRTGRVPISSRISGSTCCARKSSRKRWSTASNTRRSAIGRPVSAARFHPGMPPPHSLPRLYSSGTSLSRIMAGAAWGELCRRLEARREPAFPE